MEEIYANIEHVRPVKPKPSANQTGPRSSERSFHRAIVLCLGLLSVFLLAGLIGLGIHYRDTIHDSMAELLMTKANMTERLQASNDKLSSISEERDLLKANLTEMTKELDRLQSLSKQNHDTIHDTMAELLMTKANMTERLQASNNKLSSISEERDLLKASLTEMTNELDRLQSLSKQKKTCPSGWRMFSSTCYFFSTVSDSWEKGRRDCRDRGADLVMIDSHEEQEFLTKIINQETWIGLNDRDNENTWKWSDETPLTLAYWRKGQPDNGDGDPKWGEEDCAHLEVSEQPKGSWNDRRCDFQLQWICEKMA